jgi:hypothetical protein
MSESSLSTRWWNQTRLQRATEKTYLSQLAAAQVQPNLKMRTAAHIARGLQIVENRRSGILAYIRAHCAVMPAIEYRSSAMNGRIANSPLG